MPSEEEHAVLFWSPAIVSKGRRSSWAGGTTNAFTHERTHQCTTPTLCLARRKNRFEKMGSHHSILLIQRQLLRREVGPWIEPLTSFPYLCTNRPSKISATGFSFLAHCAHSVSTLSALVVLEPSSYCFHGVLPPLENPFCFFSCRLFNPGPHNMQVTFSASALYPSPIF